MRDHADSAALRQRFDALEHPVSEAAREALRGDIGEYVDRVRGLGWPPERVIIAVKHLARDAGLYPTTRVLVHDAQLDAADTLLVEIVGWCIERYYFRPE